MVHIVSSSIRLNIVQVEFLSTQSTGGVICCSISGNSTICVAFQQQLKCIFPWSAGQADQQLCYM